jgi:DNA-binding MarR family transcriptional regulator
MVSEARLPADDVLSERAETWPQAATPVARLMTRLVRCAVLMLRRSEAEVGRFGLTVSEFEALAALRSAPPPHERTPGEIGQSLLITSGGLSKVLATLSDRGLVSRTRAAGDRREKPVRLTTEGRELIERAMAALLRADAALVSAALLESEAERLTELVDRLLAAIEPDAPAGKEET